MAKWWRPTRALPLTPPGPNISSDQAFDILCAKALEQEPFPREIVAIGIATGWAERIRELGGTLGWDVQITITDKPTPKEGGARAGARLG